MNHKFPAKIFIDGGVPEETNQAKKLLGFLDGQTTNPSLIAKNLKSRLGNGQPVLLTESMALEEYKRIVTEMNLIIPQGSISIQVFVDQETKAEEMLEQARERNKWIPNASIKFPCISEGLKAAEIACREMPINITLVFSQSQAAAVYESTKNAKFPVFISPFVGRLDDKGENGMQVIENILRMYKEGNRHIEVLTASVRNIDHILYALHLRSNIITIPLKVFSSWADLGFKMPEENYTYPVGALKAIHYNQDIVLGKNWQEYDLQHELTDKGVSSFWSDWMGLF
ncbi:hypothetical protein A2960_06395 [Candidatus Gottesmanbacteria bacterium RIFCSPLOWO2_01_FULL_39_12b]|uniref:Transaldolase n=1 Tax=Candidatus Gottesmanbacteria bacterium RIFCSPLOWO2_01_FULL_39_12b TaxID=1798388 RepID=A0A1F6ARV2_9BACT|nr:MAG: hypothetical protein A2960_06395 [Candidatus Gottesmanbacteria bacterium RIFCSPLOWO2_01_FULL_39_12b]